MIAVVADAANVAPNATKSAHNIRTEQIKLEQETRKCKITILSVRYNIIAHTKKEIVFAPRRSAPLANCRGTDLAGSEIMSKFLSVTALICVINIFYFQRRI